VCLFLGFVCFLSENHPQKLEHGLLCFSFNSKIDLCCGCKASFVHIVGKRFSPTPSLYLDCVVTGGLGNQMLEMMSCAFVALSTNRTLILTTAPGARVPETASLLRKASEILNVGMSYFDMSASLKGVPDPTLTVVFSAATRTLVCDKLDEGEFAKHKRVVLRIPKTGSCFYLTGHFISLNRHYANLFERSFGRTPYSVLAKHLFAPTSAIRKEIDRTFEPMQKRTTIGVHLRFGVGKKDLYWNNDSSRDMGLAAVKCIEPWLALQDVSEARIYLATDNIEIRDLFKLRFGEECMLSSLSLTPPDNEHNDLLVRDLFSLVRTTHFLGTFYSSITTQVALQRNASVGKYLLRDGSCFDFTSSESFWPKSKTIASLYPGIGIITPNVSCIEEDLKKEYGL
jgi:hypothetical protein